MGPTWILSAPDGLMFTPWTLLSGMGLSQIQVMACAWQHQSITSTNVDFPLVSFLVSNFTFRAHAIILCKEFGDYTLTSPPQLQGPMS